MIELAPLSINQTMIFVTRILTTIGGESRPEKKVNIWGRNVTWSHSIKNIHGQVDMSP